MNIMKLIGILLLAISFIKCGTTKLDNNPPFSVTSTSINDSQDYTELKISVSKESKVSFQELYFNGKKAKTTLQNDGKTIIAKFSKLKIMSLNNLQLHGNAKKEFGNTVPQKQEEIQLNGNGEKEVFPFKLKKNEAVLSYFYAGKINYFKIKNMQ